MTSEEAMSANMARIIGRAVSEADSVFRGGGMPRNVTTPTDPITGGFENEDGEWTQYFKVGMAVGSAPVRNPNRYE